MNSEQKYEQILDQFVDAMNAGENLPIDELLSAGEAELVEMLPLLDFIAWFKVSSSPVTASEKSTIKDSILQHAAGQDNWSMQSLIAASNPNVITRARQSGMTKQQIDMLSADTTPINIDKPNDVVQRLSEKHGVQFFNLLGWVRQLVSDVLSTNHHGNLSPAFTRQEDTDSNTDSED